MSSGERRVAVTAAGMISPLGCGPEETAASLKAGRDCIAPVTLFDVQGCRSGTAGEVRLPAGEGGEDHSAARDRHRARLHRAGRMMIAATLQLQQQDPDFQPESAVIGTTSGGMSFGEVFYRLLMDHDPLLSDQEAGDRRAPSLIANYSPQKPVLDAQAAAGWQVPSQIIANACASGSNAIGHAFDLIRTGRRKAVLSGGYDALSQLVFCGFDALQASTAGKCQPFDAGRTGLVLGEGAALLALEDLDTARRRGAPILGLVTGYGLSTDNYHLTQPHPSGEGPLQAMRRALASAGVEPGGIDYVNAHGTATEFNDATEGLAISQLFGRIPVSSTKSMMGHSLGAAGAVEAAACLIALRDGFLPPNINFSKCDEAFDLDIVANEARDSAPQRVISNSFGFGGTNASVILEKAAA